MAVRAAGDISQAKGSDAAPSAAVNTRPTVELSSGAEARHLSALEAGAIRRALRQLQLATDPSKFELAADTLRRLDPRNPALLSLSEKAQQLRQGACSEDPD